jgi:hypothetical protein
MAALQTAACHRIMGIDIGIEMHRAGRAKLAGFKQTPGV